MKKVEDSLIKPRGFKKLRRKKVVYIPVDSSSHIIRKALKRKSIKVINLGISQLYLLKDKFVLYQLAGAPAAVLFLEGLIASGAKQIILLGFCGSLSPEHPMKSAVCISEALSEEGTSRHYFTRKKYFKPSLDLKNRIRNRLNSLSLPFREGSVVSTDAPYRETKSWLEQKKKMGIDVVDMETSAAFSLAEFRGVESAALMIVSDELWTGEWKSGFSDPGLDEKIKQYFLPFI